jgi:putative solute:sodium symporter small subunit
VLEAHVTRERQIAYWRSNLRYIAALLAVWLAISCGVSVLFAGALDAWTVAGFPIGFWFGQQGAILVFVALVFVYVWLMNRLDRRHGVYER